MLFHMLLGYDKTHREFYRVYVPQYVRVLGMNENGRELLRLRKEADDCIIVTNPSKQKGLLSAQDAEILSFEEKASALYHLFEKNVVSDEKTKPIIEPCEER